MSDGQMCSAHHEIACRMCSKIIRIKKFNTSAIIESHIISFAVFTFFSRNSNVPFYLNTIYFLACTMYSTCMVIF
jgi:hypothetical protein